MTKSDEQPSSIFIMSLQSVRRDTTFTFIFISGDDLNDVGSDGGRFKDFSLEDVGKEDWFVVVVILHVDHHANEIPLRRSA